MKLRSASYLLIGLATVVVLVSLGGLLASANQQQPLPTLNTKRVVQAARPAIQSTDEVPALPTPQVVVGTPAFYAAPAPRYTIAKGRGEVEPIDLVDTVTGQVTRLQTDDGHAIFGAMDDRYLLWWGAGVMHVRQLETGVDLTTFPASQANPYVPPQIAGDWLAFGYYNQTGTAYTDYTLFAANIATNEIITLTRHMNTQGTSIVGGYFGISEQMAAWFEGAGTIIVYDLERRQELTRLTEIYSAFGENHTTISSITPGESVITWSGQYGYDLITHSYFRIENRKPVDWGEGRISDISRIQEKNRILTWYFEMRDGTRRDVRAPLLDATPSTAPCIEGQNLVQNGDLEDIATHNVWQQSGSPSELIVNQSLPNAPQAGQWAIRLGRYNNTASAIQQTLNLPSGVKQISLSFDVRASSWDIWGGDRLEVDLIDPITNQSILATPVQWTNVQLNTGNWVPLQVALQGWPGIDTPVQLVFRAQTDWAFPTDFTLDNIHFITGCQ